MSLLLPNFFATRGYLSNIQVYQVGPSDMAAALAALRSDVDSFFLNGLISFASAVSAMRRNNYSWSFIQSYYSVFYLAKAYAGISGYCVVYKDKSPFGIKIQLSERFESLKGNSHDVVFKQFKKYFSSSVFLANTIEGKNPVDWFNENRNKINYTTNPLPDPMPPINLFVYDKGFRKWMATYLSDDAHQYTFDPDHCYMSYPIQLFTNIYSYYEDNSLVNNLLTEDRLNHLKENLSDDKGPIAPFFARLNKISP